jgi:DNA repair exonuclease SbcCD ATPase subunit
MIHSLKLRNFKKHSALDIEFTTGLNGIFGPNYTGKTTILYGILYALGGASHVPGTNIQNRSRSGDDI